MILELFKFDSCPYCRKVMRYIDDHGISNITYRDIHKDPDSLDRLISTGGKYQVPCLFIDGAPLYESDDIIHWMEQNI